MTLKLTWSKMGFQEMTGINVWENPSLGGRLSNDPGDTLKRNTAQETNSS